METSQVPEECSSSESGWTMYIGSPSPHEDDLIDDEEGYDSSRGGDYSDGGEDDVHDGNNVACKDGAYHADYETDDSMASDAASSPSHRKFPCCLEHENDGETKRSLKVKSEKAKAEARRIERWTKGGDRGRKEFTVGATSARSRIQFEVNKVKKTR